MRMEFAPPTLKRTADDTQNAAVGPPNKVQAITFCKLDKLSIRKTLPCGSVESDCNEINNHDDCTEHAFILVTHLAMTGLKPGGDVKFDRTNPRSKTSLDRGCILRWLFAPTDHVRVRTAYLDFDQDQDLLASTRTVP